MASLDAELVSTIKFVMNAESSWQRRFRRTDEINSKLGEQLGHDVARIFASSLSLADLALKFSSFWAVSGLGEMKVVRRDPLLFELKNCYDCTRWMKGVTATSCAFKRSFVETVFEDALNRSIHVEEIECCRRPAPACLFGLSETTRRPSPVSSALRRIRPLPSPPCSEGFPQRTTAKYRPQ